MDKIRIEEDAIGKLELPKEALYGINSLRAHNNFTVTSKKVDPAINSAIIMVKDAAALTNKQAGVLSEEKYHAIHQACQELLTNFKDYQSSFITSAIQGGAGTSTNMNANEVIANLATKLGEIKIDSHNDVNQAQSTNDAYPTAGKIAILNLILPLYRAIQQLINKLEEKARVYQKAIKVGRTQLQDALPTTFGNTFHAYASVLRRDLKRIKTAQIDIATINMGGTAIGTGMNTTKYYQSHITENLSKITNLPLKTAPDLIDETQNCDGYVEFSGAIKTLSTNLAKMGNDFRLLGSGPQAGLNEFFIPKVQCGSSIMPGKINPVIPEALVQTAYEAIGNDTIVTLGSEHGELELNAFEPVMLDKILESERHLTNAINMFIERCLEQLTVNTELGKKEVHDSAVIATALNPILGYDITTKIVKEALKSGKPVKQIVEDQKLIDEKTLNELLSVENLTNQK